jgi:tRNA 2-thiouridine synthesizing protein E
MQRDIEGYVFNPDEWSRDLAQILADEEQIELTDDYWQVLCFIREYWQENRVAPDVRHVVDYLMRERGIDKKTAKKHLFDMFPYGYVKQACKIAGMQRPRAWSTG